MRPLAIWTSAATILIVNLILWLGLLDAADGPLFGFMLDVYHLVLPLSSVLMLALLARDGHRAGAALFAAVIGGMLLVATARLAGEHISRRVHFCLDLCALDAYLIVVPWYLSKSMRKSATQVRSS